MAAPATCVIESPAEDVTIYSGPDGVATIAAIAVSTDPVVSVQLEFDGTPEGAPDDSDAQGDVIFTDVEFPIGVTVLTAVAGTDPETTESDPINVTVVNPLDSIVDGPDRSVRWYLNYLAGEDVSAGPGLTARAAACAWAGVSVTDYGLTGALNVKAGNTDRSTWQSTNACVNRLAYGLTGPWLPHDTDVVWLSTEDALLLIAQNLLP